MDEFVATTANGHKVLRPLGANVAIREVVNVYCRVGANLAVANGALHGLVATLTPLR
jgi:hypothetical protein